MMNPTLPVPVLINTMMHPMRVKEVAVRLAISPSVVYSLVATGKLRCYRIGTGRGAIRIDEDQLAQYLQGAEQQPALPLPSPVAPRRIKLKHLRL